MSQSSLTTQQQAELISILEGEGLSFSSHSAVISTFGQYFARTGRVPTKFHRDLINANDV